MTAVVPPAYIQASSHPADSFRRAISFDALGQQGVRSWVTGDMLVTANGTPNMTVNVAAGQALINGTQNTTSQGSYECLNDATVNLSIAASDPTNPRIDIVVAQIRDAAYSGANNDFILAVVTGTPAPSPAAPGTPNNAIVLAQVSVAANATSVTSGNITDKRPIFGSPFHAEVYNAAAQTIPNATTTTINNDTIEGDPSGSFNITTHVYTCPVPGRYLVLGSISVAGTGSTGQVSMILKNGGEAKRTVQGATNNTGNLVGLPVSGIVRCSASDTLATGYNGPGPIATNPGASFTYASFTYLGPN